MAQIVKRDGRDKPWQVRYRDPEGRQRSRQFVKKVDAERFANTVEVDKLTGRYVDPEAGKTTLAAFFEGWLAQQTFDTSTREAVETRMRRHVLPHLGEHQLRAIKPSGVQTWLRALQADLAPSYVRVILANLSAVLGAAVEDGLLPSNPCAARSVKAPAVEDRKVIPWPRERVEAVVAAHPEAYRAVAMVAAGCGLRQGECFGLTAEDVDFLRRRLHVRRQVKLVGGKPTLAPPKGGRTREVPLPDAVGVALAERMRTHPPQDGTVFTSREGGLIDRTHYNSYVWKKALRQAGVEPSRANGMHALRHHYASALLEAGVSIRAVADYLGHHDPGFTLRTYAHLMPQAEDRARQAMDAALGGESSAPDVHRVGE